MKGGKMSSYRSELFDDIKKTCVGKRVGNDRCKALKILQRALGTIGAAPAAPSGPHARYKKALGQVVKHYCKGETHFCGTAKQLQSKYDAAMKGGKMSSYRSELFDDIKKTCVGKRVGNDRCKALKILQRALGTIGAATKSVSKTSSAASSDGVPTADYSKSLHLFTSFYCKGSKDTTLLCQTSRGLLRQFKLAIKLRNLKTFMDYFSRFEGRYCAKVKSHPKACKVLMLLKKKVPSI